VRDSDWSKTLNTASQEAPLQVLGRAAAGLRLDTLPDEVLMRARQRVLDTVGCLVAGYRAGISDTVRDYVRAQGGRPEATLLPTGEKTTASLAALAHATYIFGLELSDAAPRGTVHPGCEIVSAALAIAERDGLGGDRILPAVVAGYEVEIRFGRALHPHAFYLGWSTIGLLGSIGPAVTAAHLLGLDAAGIANAISVVLSLTPAATGRVNQGGSVKWLVGGHACATGMLAADMAKRGLDGMHDVAGVWLPAICKENHPERLTEGISQSGAFTQWELLSGVLTKYYATVGPIAATLDATFALLQEHPIRAEDVVEIHADCPKRTAIFNKPHPESDSKARASLPHCVAVAICTRDPAQLLGPAYQPDALANPAYRQMAEKVRVTENADYERQYPARSLARVSIRLKDGTVHSKEVDRSENPRYLTPGDADIEAKFRLIAAPALGQAKTDTAIALVRQFERVQTLDALLAALKP
jgi:2-methylcitrate dehydratase PrpD